MESVDNSYSVLMSVYHKEKAEYLKQAMDSVWSQTVSTDDFVLVCDGPLNTELVAVIEEMQEEHRSTLHVVRLEKNGGLGNALNVGIKECKHELVARMDSDDISRPDRCERQLAVFGEHPEVSICSGTILEFRDDVESVTGKRELPQADEDIKDFSRKRNPFNHPAVMFKRSVVEAAGGYDEAYHLFEDYYLWIRMFQNGAVGYNIKEPLLYMRTPEDLYMRRGGTVHLRYAQIPQMDSQFRLVELDRLHCRCYSARRCLYTAEQYTRDRLQETTQIGIGTRHPLSHSFKLWECEVA